MKLKSLIAGLVAGVALIVQAGAALADGKNPVVVELFTSQGCSSCPPADALIQTLAHRDDVLPLALHVDYWDYIGWKDSFARPEHTRRQKAYARAAGSRSIYTPQVVVGGVDQIVGTRPMEVADAIMKRMDAEPPVDLDVARHGDSVEITAPPLAHAEGSIIVSLVRYIPEREVDILRGENAGKTLVYSNIVTDWRPLGRWDGREPLKLEMTLSGEDAAAVLLQSADHGPIIAAARLP